MSEFIYPDLTNSTFDSPYGRLMALPGDLRPAVGVIHGHSTSTEDPDPPPVTGQRFAVVDEDDLAAQERLFDLTGAYNFAIVNGANPLFQIIGSSGQLVFGQYGTGVFDDTPTRGLGVDALGNVVEYVPSAPSVYTVDNGLTESEPGNFQLGGALLHETTITAGIYRLIVSTDQPDINPLRVDATNGLAVEAEVTTGVAVFGRASEGGLGGLFITMDVSTASVLPVVYVQRQTNGTTAADGIGASINYSVSTDSILAISNELISKWTTADGDTRVSEWSVKGVDNTISQTIFALAGSGQGRLHKYGVGTFVDTPVYGLGVLADGTIVEYDPAMGSGGSGVDLFRFAVATEDDLAGEIRAFEQAGFSFTIYDGGGTDATLQLDPANGSYQLGKNVANGAYFSANSVSNSFTAQASNANYIAMDGANFIFHVVMAGGFDHLNLDAGTGLYEIGDISAFGVGNNNFIRINDAAQTAFFRIANFAGATVGDVLTLVNTTTGEVEWGPGGGGGGSGVEMMRFGYPAEDNIAGENRNFDMTGDPTYRLTLNAVNTFAEGPAFVVNSLGSIGTAIYGTTIDGRGLWGYESGGGVAVMGISDGAGGYALYGAASLGNALYTLSQTGIAGEFHIQVPSLDTVNPIIILSRELPGPDQPLVGIGGSIDYYTSTDAGGTSIISELTNQLISTLIDVTNGTRTSEFLLTGVGNAIMNVLMTFSGLGLLSFPQGMSDYADDAAAAAGTPVIPVNGVYRNGSQLMIRVA